MNEEAGVVMAAFTIRVALVGAIMLAYPRIARKGLMFGTYVGEERAEGAVRHRLLRAWDRWCALILTVALIVGWSIGFTGRWIPGNLIGTVVLLVPFVPLYFWMHAKARGLAPPEAAIQARRSAAPLEVDESRGEGVATLAIVLTLVGSVSLFVYAVQTLPALPEQIPTLAKLWGVGEGMMQKSLVPLILFPSYNFVFAPAFAVLALMVAHAKQSVRGGSGGQSKKAQDAFRVATSHLFAGTGLFTALVMGVTSLQMIRVWQGRADSLSGGIIGGTCVAMILYMGISLFRVMRLGQGGARLESGSPEAPLTGGLADNSRWKLGILYVDSEDPAVMVEARWGIGYTMNLGSRIAQVFLAVFGVALLGLTMLTVAAAGVF